MFVASETNRILVGHASDGASVEITGHIPEGAQAVITPVTLTRDQLIAFYGEELVDAVDNLVVYDICIMVDGEEWEPDKDVSVVIHSPVIETKESNEEITVTHLDEEAETAEKVETEVTEEGDITFATDSFSLWGLYTYTVDYYLNDNEYHQPGNTSMLLSELFEHLLIGIRIEAVTDVEFTDYTLLQIDREGDDFRITSLKPFTTDEVMTITFVTGDQLTIAVEDLMYASYTYDSSVLTPYTGSFNYVGHYNIFGGGNGLATIVKDSTNLDDDWENWWAGEWGGNSYWDRAYDSTSDGVTVHLPSLSGKAVGNDQNGNALVGETNKFKTGSSADITWDGDLEQAFLSFSWLYYYRTTRPTSLIVHLDLYAQDGGHTVIELDTTNETNDPRDPDPIVGNNTTQAWRMLSFDATKFINAHGEGTYTMVATLSVPAGYTMAYANMGGSISDMGFTIFGVTADSSQPVSAVVGVVDEIMISKTQGDSQSLPDRDAVVMLQEGVTPRGNGKAWFN